MLDQNSYPLTWPLGWPRTKTPQASRFVLTSTGHHPGPAHARDTLLSELDRLRAVNVSISTNLPLARDGRFKEAKSNVPADAGAAVYFTLKDRKQVLACDKWKTVGENLWAIAKTIEATRGIERWGSVTTEQAFAGYTALPEKTQASCWEVLGIKPEGFNLDNPAGIAHAEQIILSAWREKIRVAHPDVEGGSSEAFAAVNAAKDMALQLIRQ